MTLQRIFWPLLTLAVSLGFALGASRPALLNPLVVHDDVRQHVFWVPRLHDPALFAGDWIADYYQAQAPSGYQAIYWLVTLGTDAVTASKLLPLALTLVLALGGYWLAWTLWRRREAAAISTVLLLWCVWQYDDVASATPRAYALPLLTLQLAAAASGRRGLAVALLPIQALLYPLGCALAAVTLGGWAMWHAIQTLRGDPTPLDLLSGAQRDWGGAVSRSASQLFCELLPIVVATLVALAIVAWDGRDAARYGPTVSGALAREMSEFQQGGRAAYFVADRYRFWLESSRSGFALSPRDPLLGDLPVLVLPFGLALLLAGWLVAGRLGLVSRPAVPSAGGLLLVIFTGSLALFAAAHALLYLLYLPARHVQFSLPLVWALAGGLFWTLLGDVVTRCAPSVTSLVARLRLTGSEAFVLVGIGLLTLHPPPPGDFYVVGRHPAVYAYLRQTPKNTLVAALPSDSSALPLFGQRGVLTSYEHLLPYHAGYYAPLAERTDQFRTAFYAPTLRPLAAVIRAYDVGVVVANADALERRVRSERGRPPALEALLNRCGALRERELVVLPAACILAAADASR